MTTTFPNVHNITRNWVLIDAQGQVLGRLAARVAGLLRGKHKAAFTPFLDTGDFVVVINAKQVKVTGQKLAQKLYRTYSGYPGGLRTQTLDVMLQKQPERVIEHAVKGMLPQGPLGRRLLTKLKVYAGADHPHGAQRPAAFSLERVTSARAAAKG